MPTDLPAGFAAGAGADTTGTAVKSPVTCTKAGEPVTQPVLPPLGRTWYQSLAALRPMMAAWAPCVSLPTTA